MKLKAIKNWNVFYIPSNHWTTCPGKEWWRGIFHLFICLTVPDQHLDSTRWHVLDFVFHRRRTTRGGGGGPPMAFGVILPKHHHPPLLNDVLVFPVPRFSLFNSFLMTLWSDCDPHLNHYRRGVVLLIITRRNNNSSSLEWNLIPAWIFYYYSHRRELDESLFNYPVRETNILQVTHIAWA